MTLRAPPAAGSPLCVCVCVCFFLCFLIWNCLCFVFMCVAVVGDRQWRWQPAWLLLTNGGGAQTCLFSLDIQYLWIMQWRHWYSQISHGYLMISQDISCPNALGSASGELGAAAGIGCDSKTTTFECRNYCIFWSFVVSIFLFPQTFLVLARLVLPLVSLVLLPGLVVVPELRHQNVAIIAFFWRE